MIKRRIFLQLFLAVLVVALFAGAAHAITHINIDWPPDDNWREELWVVNGPGGQYGVGIPILFDDYITVYVGPRWFTVPLDRRKLAAAAAGGGVLLIVILMVGGTCALPKDRKVSP